MLGSKLINIEQSCLFEEEKSEKSEAVQYKESFEQVSLVNPYKVRH